MRAVVIDSQGTFRLEQRPEPVAGPGAVVVRVRAAGLNAADLQQARGDYPAPQGWPADVPGLEVAGEVEQVGAGVTGVVPGDRVMALVGGGGHAERITVPADLLLPVPEGLPWEEAAGFPEAFSTAWDALVTQAGVRAGDRVLVNGAAGGWARQWCRSPRSPGRMRSRACDGPNSMPGWRHSPRTAEWTS
ncbi:alcohol dehydrogenase catalytic domain-containing protein [Actinoallomurus sp. NPDC050550]|uniref:alcohol dehydrogenase catalytic domain-containing protein n=1 Tax=Actinoallomurus sp. NPDC050550 TaxID=3154937 RepID=UPI003407ADB8